MKVEKYGSVVVVDEKNIEINGWEIRGGSGDELKRLALRRALWILFKFWIFLWIF